MSEYRICSRCTKQWPLTKVYFTLTNGNFYSYCKICTRKASAIYRQKNRKREMLRSAKKRATKASIPFDITENDIVIPEFCPILGIKLVMDNDKSENNSPSLDRIIPEKGYVSGNVCVISMKANRLKDNASLEDLQKIVKYMESHV